MPLMIKAGEHKDDEILLVCDYCLEPSELETRRDIVENSYGNGSLVSESIEWKGSICCGSDVYEWHFGDWKMQFPTSALENNYITEEEYKAINKEIEELEG
tara:strand:+ start:617 stop:919 length:303 start_codon:yes stop_codon:yes gene_type:complete